MIMWERKKKLFLWSGLNTSTKLQLEENKQSGKEYNIGVYTIHEYRIELILNNVSFKNMEDV